MSPSSRRCVVKMPPCAQRPADLDHFLRAGGARRRVGQPGGHADGAGLQRLFAARMTAISAGAASRSRSGTAATRVMWPSSMAQLVAADARAGPADNRRSVRSGTSRRRRPAGPAAAPRAGRGASEMPQLPPITVVTPWLTLGAMAPSDSMARSSWVWASMKPGASTRPRASTSARRARRPGRHADDAPSSTATSPSKRGAPVPSTISAPRINRSWMADMRFP